MIYVVGDIMLDKYLFGAVNRMSPEAPVPIILEESNELFIGGAGNVAYNIKNLTEKVKIFSIIGKDEDGRLVQKKLQEKNISFEYVESEDNPTITKTRYLSENKQVLRVDKEKKFSLNESEELFKKVRDSISIDNPDLILISDYDKMTIHENLKIEEYFKPEMMVVDSKKKTLELFQNAFIYKSNYKELCNVANKKVQRDELKKVISGLIKKYNFQIMVTTLGSEGCFFMDKNFDPSPLFVVPCARGA